MSEQYFIRLRGRVQGPFDAERLRQLARRGQFSRLHEVSTDGQQWISGKDRPELFAVAAEAPVPVATAQRASAQSTNQHSALATPPTTTPPAEAWFYVEGGKEQGPVDRHVLASLFASGQLAPNAEVWRSGMNEWVPASNIPGLISIRSVSPASEKQTPMVEMPQVSGDVVRVLVESRPWLIFIGVVTFLYAALLALAGMVGIVVGSRRNQAPLTIEGFASLIGAAVFCLAGILLMRYASGISQVERRNSELHLSVALARLKSFWVFVGILLIVLLVFVLLGVIIAISYTSSYSDL